MSIEVRYFYSQLIRLLRKSLDNIYIFNQKCLSLFRYILSSYKYYDLVILDDFLPNILSGFRAQEFSYILKKTNNSALYSILQTKLNKRRQYYNYFITSESQFEKYKKEFLSNFQITENKVQPFYTWTKIKSKLAYIVFLENAYTVIDYLEKNKIRFILELYPGGGFLLLNHGAQYEKLKRVLTSPNFRQVIVTQKVTQKFLLENKLCSAEQISFKYWGICPISFVNLPEKSIKNTKIINICFTAGKYMDKGLDKGYDIFIETAHILLSQNPIFHFHIVGGFSEKDIPILPEYSNYFHFYGFLKTNDFVSFYEDKDIFVSPNRPHTLAMGAFDGFPTGACVEAGQNGLCMIFSDPLDSNFYFTDYKDAIFTENDPIQIADIIMELSKKPEKIHQIGEEGKKTLLKLDPKDQLDFRLSLINKFINSD